MTLPSITRKLRKAVQAIVTAMKASKNISTAPASGKTIGMEETTASTASGSLLGVWGVGLDMMIPLVIQIRNL